MNTTTLHNYTYLLQCNGVHFVRPSQQHIHLLPSRTHYYHPQMVAVLVWCAGFCTSDDTYVYMM